MRFLTIVLAAALLAGAAVTAGKTAVTHDGALIVNSGSTNTPGFAIKVWSDGSASVSAANRMGPVASSTPKSFTIAPALATQFFADLKAARGAKAAGAPCMKSASFGSTTHVTWHGWTSPDLECPSDDAQLTALVRDVSAIRSASK